MVTVDGHRAGAPAWFELMTLDGAAGRDFYAPLLGWGVQQWPREHGDYLVCTLGERAVAGIDEPTGPHAEVPTGWLVYFHVPDADACAERVTGAGGSILVAPTDIVGAGRYLMAFDPFGAVFGAWQPYGHPGSGAVNEPGAPSWTELWVPADDQPTAVAFYRTALGLTDDGASGLLLAGGRPVAGVREAVGRASEWVPFFGIADLAAASDAAASGGAKVGDRVATPAGNAVVVVDPAGASVGLVGMIDVR